ncbi:MFS transporter [Spelaeicoccus albus]|uniref:D-galactonate transporter n=1 Tax=Spelaeicoccus albus TaxID=1280376 RepID=A0A7Z0D062_9MICO|nr:MFS transporter [Spelaeicoccus albus]NYI66969.1 D-galactonate transporter [Spelaeicoccus albus]
MTDPVKTSLEGRAEPSASATEKNALYRKIAFRLMPLLVVCYLVSYIDRTNIGIAQVGLHQDLGFSEGVYAFGVSLYFVGFILFEVPSNALMARIGARKTLLRIMIAWGLVTIATMFVHNAVMFYVARFLLGVAEAGFFPGCLLLLSYWFPSSRRTRMTAIFFMSIPVSGIIGSLVSGWIMSVFGGIWDLSSWQWLFLLEGIPAVLLAFVVFVMLSDRPAQAPWLSDREKAIVENDLADDQRRKAMKPSRKGGLRQALSDPRVWILGLGACAAYTLANAVSFWTPRIINEAGIDDPMLLGLLSAIPPVFGIVAMQLVGRSSDKRLERRWHTAVCWLCAIVAMVVLSFFLHSPYLVVVLLCVMAAAHYSGLTVYYSIPSIYLGAKSAATGIAFVTAMGSVAAALAPAMLGWIHNVTGNISLGLVLSAAIIFLGVLVVLIGISAKSLREKPNQALRDSAE